ncbi:hypothetical protein [Methylobacter sp. BlB1]|uniref:hypothetical protein n=1 Tax=Methylobacter sp. BlB1 TaxID=2785914 RepID=UPI0018958476|nr:hypothetical protein [Methylobacter sp. BlB1]MBF6651134.1 hypothetical protein [Methylobacter sp. BlB1]
MKKTFRAEILLAIFLVSVTGTQANSMTKIEPNDRLEAAQTLDHFDSEFDNATVIACASRYSANNDCYGYFSFSLTDLSRAITDMDADSIDTAHNLYATYNDSDVFSSDNGQYNNSYGDIIETYLNANFYYAIAKGYQNRMALSESGTLHMSASHPSTVSLPAIFTLALLPTVLTLLLFGLGIVGLFTPRKQRSIV